MGKDGKKSARLNRSKVKFGECLLVTPEENVRSKQQKKISFSFIFFKQIENFGIGNCPSSWLVGFLERLCELGNKTSQELFENRGVADSLRFHPINWTSKNVPLRREDLTWLPEEIRNNEDDFPMFQCSISAGTDRFAGFFSRESVFYIVLLDPNHNIQPSRKTNYQIQPTTKGISQYDELLNKLENVKYIVQNCPNRSCVLNGQLKDIEGLHDNIVYVGLDADFYEKYQNLVSEHTLQEILENGILSL